MAVETGELADGGGKGRLEGLYKTDRVLCWYKIRIRGGDGHVKLRAQQDGASGGGGHASGKNAQVVHRLSKPAPRTGHSRGSSLRRI